MRRLPVVAALAALAALAACADIPPTAPPPAGDAHWVASPAEVWMVVGGEIRVDSLLRVGFTRVIADSRCPATVLCVWAGDGAVALAVAAGMGPSYPLELHTTLDPRLLDFAGYRLTLVELAPYPYIPGPIPADEYALRLRVERLLR